MQTAHKQKKGKMKLLGSRSANKITESSSRMVRVTLHSKRAHALSSLCDATDKQKQPRLSHNSFFILSFVSFWRFIEFARSLQRITQINTALDTSDDERTNEKRNEIY